MPIDPGAVDQTVDDPGEARGRDRKGAMSAFLVLHISVINHFIHREHSTDYLKHLVYPIIGFVILAFVVVNAKVAAQELAFIWIAVGVVILLIFKARHRDPELAGLEED